MGGTDRQADLHGNGAIPRPCRHWLDWRRESLPVHQVLADNVVPVALAALMPDMPDSLVVLLGGEEKKKRKGVRRGKKEEIIV